MRGAKRDPPVWLDGLKTSQYSALTEDDVQADIVVIGAGFTGMSAAYHLSQACPQERIIVLEQNQVCYGASSRNSGHFGYTSSVSGTSFERVKAAYDFEKAAQRNLIAMCEAAQRAGHDVGFRPTTYVIPGTKGQEEYLQREAEVTRQLLATDSSQATALKEMKMLNAEEVQAKLKSAPGFFSCGIYMTDSHGIHPAKFVHALATMCVARGVTVYEQTKVTHMRPDDKVDNNSNNNSNSGVIIDVLVKAAQSGGRPTKRTLRAKTVVIATNGFLPNISCDALKEIQRQHLTLNSCLMATDVLTPKQRESIGLSPDLTFVEPPNFGFGVRIFITHDWRLCVRGSTHYLYNNGEGPPNLKEVEAELRGALFTRYPQLQGIGVSHCHEGLLGCNFSGAVRLGRLKAMPNVLYAVEYNAHGVGKANLCGRLLTELYTMKAGDKPSAELDYLQKRPAPPNMPPEPLFYLGFQLMKWQGARALKRGDVYRGLRVDSSALIRNVLLALVTFLFLIAVALWMYFSSSSPQVDVVREL